MKVTDMSYGQFLLNTQANYTGTYFADMVSGLDHNSVYRYLKHAKMAPRMIWEKTSQFLEPSEDGYVIFDDTVADKSFSFDIELARSQYSGNVHGIVKGIGVVTCLYYNPDRDRTYALDFRIFAPDVDGKTKLDHVKEMLDHLVHSRKLAFRTVLMDSWYATTDMMLHIDKGLRKTFYCPLKSNRLVHEGMERSVAKPVCELTWTDVDLKQGKNIHAKGFPVDYRLKLFRITISADRTELIVTNDLTRYSSDDARKESAIRWKIEEFHRELKQLTGIEKCQTRLERSQRNHICLSILAWICLKEAAIRRGVTMYMQKREPLLTFMAEQWRHPATVFC